MNLKCLYFYVKDGYTYATPSLDKAIERTTEDKIKVKCGTSTTATIKITNRDEMLKKIQEKI